MGHAYSVHHAFEIKDADGKEHKIIMIRNPWGVESGYKDEWGPQDERWTDSVAQQVIDVTGFDPRTSTLEKSIMFLPHYNLKKCFEDISVAYAQTGYTDNWYDALDMDENFHSYYFTVPEKNGDFYITAETYSENIVPSKCTTAESDEGLFTDAKDLVTAPLVSIIVYKADETAKEFK
jgi:hypothetical protein